MIQAYCCTVRASSGAIYNTDFLAECSKRNYCCSTVHVFFFFKNGQSSKKQTPPNTHMEIGGF